MESAHCMTILSGKVFKRNLASDVDLRIFNRLPYSVWARPSEPHANGVQKTTRSMRVRPQLSVLFAVRERYTDLRVNEEFAGEALFRCSQGRAKIAQFVVNLICFSYGLGDFFAEQIAVSITQPV